MFNDEKTAESRSSFGKAESDKYHQGEKWKRQRVRALRTMGAYLLLIASPCKAKSFAGAWRSKSSEQTQLLLLHSYT